MPLEIRAAIAGTTRCATVLIGISFSFFTLDALDAADWNAPPNPLRLPVPGGGSLEFVPVFLGVGDTLLGTVEFTSGSPGSTPEETPTISTVGGTFRANTPSGRDWFYYLGTTEVPRGIFNAVLREAGLPEKEFPEGDSDLPATGITWFDVQQFLRAYNSWLARQSVLPEGQPGSPVFVRLPTEAEWEFAARGGARVDRSTFDRDTPYAIDEVSLYEWVAGPASSHNKLNPARKLRPNPLGLYDMLGNASEMTSSVFQLEPGQGPVGGIVERGGNYRTRADDLRSSIRGEFPLFTEDGHEAASPSLGFRLAIGTIIYSDIERVREIRDGWEEYRATRIVPRPGTGRMQPSSQTISRETFTALDSTAASDDESVVRLRNQLQDIAAERNRYEDRSVETLVRWCSQNAHILAKNSSLLQRLSLEDLAEPLDRRLQAMLDEPGISGEIKNSFEMMGNTLKNFATNRITVLEQERANAAGVYTEALELLAEMHPEKVDAAFESYVGKLIREADGQSQASTTEIARRQLREFSKTRKVAIAQWQAELAAAYEKSQ